MTSYTIREATSEDHEAIIDFLDEHFVPEETINKSIQLCQDGYRMPYFDSFKRARFDMPNVTLMAESDEDKELLGIVLTSLHIKGEKGFEIPEPAKSRSGMVPRKMQSILDFLHFVETEGESHAKLDHDKDTAEIALLSGRKDKRVPGLGTELTKKMIEAVRGRGVKQYTVVTTSAFSAKIVKKLGFEEVWSLPYTDYKVDGKVVFETEEPHTHVRFYVLKE